MWRSIYEESNFHPNRLTVKIPGDNISGDHISDILPFFTSMKAGACLPSSVELPTSIQTNTDIYVTLDVSKVSKERLFWYLNVIRNATEQIGIMILTNHFIKNKMEPLMAYIMAHVCLPDFYGVHSVVDFPEQLRKGDTFFPDVEKVVKYVVKCHRFLTKKTKPYITEGKDFTRWQLSDTLAETRVHFKQPEELDITNLHEFSPSTRTRRKDV